MVKIKSKLTINQLILIIIGLTMICKGWFYICHGSYFVWPPNWQTFENDDVVGFLFIISGLSLAVMELFINQIPNWLRSLIYGISLFLMTAVSIVEWCHFFILGLPMSAMSNTCITLILLILAMRGDKIARF